MESLPLCNILCNFICISSAVYVFMCYNFTVWFCYNIFNFNPVFISRMDYSSILFLVYNVNENCDHIK